MLFDCSKVWKWLGVAGVPKADLSTKEGKLNMLNRFKLIQEELEELSLAIRNGDETMVMDGVIDLLWAVSNVSYSLDPEKLRKYREAVQESNWSKFCSTEKEALESQSFYDQGTHYSKFGQKIQADIVKVGHLFILKSPEGKVLKSHKYYDAKFLYEKSIELAENEPKTNEP